MLRPTNATYENAIPTDILNTVAALPRPLRRDYADVIRALLAECSYAEHTAEDDGVPVEETYTWARETLAELTA